jgi:hypothetical protein
MKIITLVLFVFITICSCNKKKELIDKLKNVNNGEDFYMNLEDPKNAAETKILIREVILASGQKLFIQIESKILGEFNAGTNPNGIKNWIEKTIDKKLLTKSDDLKDIYKTHYKGYVDDLVAGVESDVVFGRKITPYVKKDKLK